MAEKRHPGISMHKLTVGAGFEGLLFTVGCSLIFVIGFPALLYFVALSAALGIAVAIILRLVGNRRSERMKPLSILPVRQEAEGTVTQEQIKEGSLFRVPPKLCSPSFS